MDYIRAANIDDVNALAILFDGYRVFYKKESDIEAATQFLKDRILNHQSVIYVTGDAEGLTGFVQLYPIYSSTRMKRLWLLNDLFVDPNQRGKGLSLKLIEKAKQLCEETQACGLILETAKTNDIGNNLYPRAGFELDTDHNYYSWDR